MTAAVAACGGGQTAQTAGDETGTGSEAAAQSTGESTADEVADEPVAETASPDKSNVESGQQVETPAETPAATPAEPTEKPTAEPAEEPAVEPAVEPEDEPAAEPAAQQEPAQEATVEAAPKTHIVEIVNFAFSPATLEINAGDTVTFINKDPVRHTATADDKSFDTGLLNTDQEMPITFEKPGEFTYYCTPHPAMQGKIIVHEPD